MIDDTKVDDRKEAVAGVETETDNAAPTKTQASKEYLVELLAECRSLVVEGEGIPHGLADRLLEQIKLVLQRELAATEAEQRQEVWDYVLGEWRDWRWEQKEKHRRRHLADITAMAVDGAYADLKKLEKIFGAKILLSREAKGTIISEVTRHARRSRQTLLYPPAWADGLGPKGDYDPTAQAAARRVPDRT